MEDENFNDSPKIICIIQVTRLGDLIQTIQSLTTNSPNKNIQFNLIALDIFAKDIEFLLKKFFTKIYYITKDFYNELEQQEELPSKKNKLIDEISGSGISALINLSWSKPANILTSLIQSRFKLGLYFDKDFNLISNDDWSKFVYTNVLPTTLNPFSLIDIYKKIIGIKGSSEFRPEFKIGGPIVIHPFSSQERKNWKIEKWIEVISSTLNKIENISIIIVGSKSDIKESEIIDNYFLNSPFKSRIENIIGQTTIEDLHNILQKCYLFVGHDSMVGHLASFNNVPCLTISLGTVRFNETMPYGDGNYNISPRTKCFPCFPYLKCDYYKCHQDVPTKVVSSAIECLIEKQRIDNSLLEDKVSNFQLNSIDIQKSFFKETEMLDTYKVLDQYPNLSSIFKIYYRILWLYSLEEEEENIKFPVIPEKFNSELHEYMDGLKYLFELNEFGKNYANYIIKESHLKNPSYEVLSTNANKIQEIDELKIKIKENYPFLSPIIDFSIFEKASLQGDNIIDVSHNALLAYQNCSNLTSILYELIEKSLNNSSLNKKQVDKSI